MANFLNFYLVKSDFQLVFISSIYGHLQYHFRMEEVFGNICKHWPLCNFLNHIQKCPIVRGIQWFLIACPNNDAFGLSFLNGGSPNTILTNIEFTQFFSQKAPFLDFWNKIYFLHSEMILQMHIDWANENQLRKWFYQMKIHEICHPKVY